MPKYEYRVLDVSCSPECQEKELNRAGQSKWELVTVVCVPPIHLYAYFKREIPDGVEK